MAISGTLSKLTIREILLMLIKRESPKSSLNNNYKHLSCNKINTPIFDSNSYNYKENYIRTP